MFPLTVAADFDVPTESVPHLMSIFHNMKVERPYRTGQGPDSPPKKRKTQTAVIILRKIDKSPSSCPV